MCASAALSVLPRLRLTRIMRPCHGRSLVRLIVVHHRATERTKIRHASAAACLSQSRCTLWLCGDIRGLSATTISPIGRHCHSQSPTGRASLL